MASNYKATYTQLADGRFRNNSTYQIMAPGFVPDTGAVTNTEKQANTVAKSIEEYRRPYAAGDRGKVLSESVGDRPLGYQGTFQEAFEGLGQPGKVGENFIVSGTQELAESFVDRFLEKTGKLPTSSQVTDFVATNLNSSWADKYIRGATPRDQTKARLVDPYLEQIGALKPQATEQPGAVALEDKLSGIYDQIEAAAPGRIARAFIPQRQRAIEEEAVLGRLRSPVSASPDSIIQQQDKLQGEALADTIGNIMQQRATGSLDIARIGQGERQMAQQNEQFGRSLSLDRERLRSDADLKERDFRNTQQANRIAQEIGRLQAQGKKPGALDYLNTVFGGIGSVGTLLGGVGSVKKAWAAGES